MTRQPPAFCRKCGEKLLKELVGAEEQLTKSGIPTPDAYDERTGKRQRVYKYSCPYDSLFNIGHTCIYSETFSQDQ